MFTINKIRYVIRKEFLHKGCAKFKEIRALHVEMISLKTNKNKIAQINTTVKSF